MSNRLLGNFVLQNFRNFLRKGQTKMTAATLEQVIENNRRSEEIISALKSEFVCIQREILANKKRQLQQENAKLQQKIATFKSQLIALEIGNGKRQIPVPSSGGARGLCSDVTQQPKPTPNNDSNNTKTESTQEKQPKEKKPKKEKPAAAPNTTAAEVPIDVGRLDMRVGKIIEVGRHPDAESLYLEKIDCGEAQPRTVVSGLVKFIPLEEMQNRMVVVMCNLKPAKMRGVTSEAMVMCASSTERVEVLSPPAGAVPGDLVHCEGFTRQPDAQLNPKKKIFETCAPDLMTNGDLVACYKGSALHVPGKGNVVAQTLKNVNVK